MTTLSESDLSHLESLIQSISWEGWPSTMPRGKVHDHIQSFVVTAGGHFGYSGKAEIRTELENRGGYIDIGWYSGNRIVAAFEVDGTVRKKSVAKLGTMPDYTRKVVISKSTNHQLISKRKSERIPEWCHHIDAKTYEYFD